jgi:hypothetical protein
VLLDPPTGTRPVHHERRRDMEINTNPMTALRSGHVAPAFRGSEAGVCPQAGFRGVFVTDVKLRSAVVPTAGIAGMVTGSRTWKPPIT